MFPFLSILFASLTAGQTIDPALYTLGSNLIIQSTFSAPVVNNQVSRYRNNRIEGWTCTNWCEVINVPRLCSSRPLPCSNNYSQGVDLDAHSFF